MPLITCPDCHREISDSAPACPGCGRPMREAASELIVADSRHRPLPVHRKRFPLVRVFVIGTVLWVFGSSYFKESTHKDVARGSQASSLQVASSKEETWVVGNNRLRSVNGWPPGQALVRTSEVPVDGGTRLCRVTISPDYQGAEQYLSVEHSQGQRSFTFRLYKHEWIFPRDSIIQASASFDSRHSVGLTGIGKGQYMVLGSDIGSAVRLNTLLSESSSLEIEFDGYPDEAWRISLAGVPQAMAKLRECAARNQNFYQSK